VTAPNSLASPYRGRFAPSPTGPLHFGSLVAAAASYLQARANNGVWLVRIEDIDPPREMNSADKIILDQLEAHGFEWDEEVLWQSTRLAAYEEVLQKLYETHQAYPCTCSRKQWATNAATGPLGRIYPGTCSHLSNPYNNDGALRIRCSDVETSFVDRLQGETGLHLRKDVGDFLLRRGDGLIAYQLAVTVDDAYQDITEVVRGHDLLLSTPCQVFLQQQLEYQTPDYMHIPVAVNTDGDKLSKANSAPALGCDAADNLLRTLRFLGLNPPADLQPSSIPEIWHWGVSQWNPAALQGISKQPEIGHLS